MRICLDLQTLQHVDSLETAPCQSLLTDTHDAIGSLLCNFRDVQRTSAETQAPRDSIWAASEHDCGLP